MSPIVIFAFNRLDPLKDLVTSLLKNPEAKQSDLYVFVDGAREGRLNEVEAVDAVKKYVKTIKGFNSVSFRFSEVNKGLGPSIISGVTEVINRYDNAIVLEDDLKVEPGFLSFMNKGLSAYKDNEYVWSICGYSNKISIPHEYPYDAYFSTRSSSWGWATWSDRWNSIDWTFERWDEWKSLSGKFNKWGGSDCFGMLSDCRSGKNKSWAIRFCFNQFLQDKVSLFPIKSLVTNNGFDGSGTNCRHWSRFKFELMPATKGFRLPQTVTINRHIHNSAMKYHSIPIRIYSKIMYLLR